MDNLVLGSSAKSLATCLKEAKFNPGNKVSITGQADRHATYAIPLRNIYLTWVR